MCIFYFSVIINAQIYQTNNSLIYISDDASVTEPNDQIKREVANINGEIYVSHDAIVYADEGVISAQLVSIDPPKRQIASNSKKVVLETKQILANSKKETSIPLAKSEYNFVSSIQDENFIFGYTNKKHVVVNPIPQLKLVLEINSSIVFHKWNYITENNFNYRIENLKKGSELHCYTRPPPSIVFFS